LTALNSEVVVDSRTGLEWQRLTGSTTYTWSDAKSHCDQLVLDGKSDWRAPTVAELESIVDYANVNGVTIDTGLFADTQLAEYWTWSYRVASFVSYTAWVVRFNDGSVSFEPRSDGYSTRCVRLALGALSSDVDQPSRRWKVNTAAGTVVDKWTGLVWQREPPTTGGSSGKTTGQFNLVDATQYCQDLVLGGHGDWRLPSLQELRGLVDRKQADPAISPFAFPNPPVTGTPTYWSITPYGSEPSSAWWIHFNSGNNTSSSVSSSVRVRCVR